MAAFYLLFEQLVLLLQLLDSGQDVLYFYKVFDAFLDPFQLIHQVGLHLDIHLDYPADVFAFETSLEQQVDSNFYELCNRFLL